MEEEKILKQFGLYDKITPSISFTSTAIRIQDLYLKENIDSFFPQSNRFLKGGYNYFTEDDALLEEQNIITIDANKFYPSCLKELEYLAKVDFLDNDLEDNNILEPDFMYLVKPEQHSILLPNTNIYLGEHLEFCKTEGLCFEILEKVKITKFSDRICKNVLWFIFCYFWTHETGKSTQFFKIHAYNTHLVYFGDLDALLYRN